MANIDFNRRNDENIVLFFTAILVVATILTFVHFYSSRQKMEQEVYLSSSVETAQSLVVLMNYNSDFTAALQTANMYNMATPFTIKFTNFKVRNPEHKPDTWELKSLEFLESNPMKPYTFEYTQAEKRKDPLFRFMAPLRANVGCLECHGDPAGELDATGFPKEGLQLGDFAGAISITLEGDYLHNFNKYQRKFLLIVIELGLLAALFGFYLWRLRIHRNGSEEEVEEAKHRDYTSRPSRRAPGSRRRY
ncbi:MAG: DUF3365 domain-containing protein [Candidatus Marinimicrobia bacterium]|nr:DUF3365 domain-containing protein [Candidatus Neomarinimicrobiota bacterium]MCF7840394.1 DUF3365 domain-containing protein [Candidatus Neomarinimicrobiota bacterium]